MKNTIKILFFLFSMQLLAQGPVIRAEVNLDDVYTQYGLSGEGVLIVMIDRGIDYTHPDFIDENGNTRLAYIYDMVDPTGANDPNNPYGVGTIHDHEALNTALANNDPPLSTDRFGHGTATTGIICGNGSGTTDGQFHGVAPKATIISIKITHDYFPPFNGQPGQDAFFDPSYIAIALQFASDKIAELGLPSITLMNIGSIGGPTDGTSMYSRAIDQYVQSGHTFVCGIGDDGGRENHASGTVSQGQTIDLLVDKANSGNLRFDLWYSESDRFTVSIERPNGIVEGPFTAPNGPNDSVDENLGDIFMAHRGKNVEFWGSDAERRELLIDFSGTTGTYKVRLQGASTPNGGEFHSTLNPSNFTSNNKFLSYVVPGYSINDYASAALNIVPTDYVISEGWYDINGNFQQFTGQGDPGELWIGASKGPTQDERLAPDIAAPGEIAFGAYSPNTWYSHYVTSLVQGGNGLYGIQNAVSAASPLVTGIIALMLEVKPNLTPSQIKNILRNSCNQDAFTGSVPNNTWGYGKINALLAIQNTISLGTDPLKGKSIVLYPSPTNGWFTIDLGKEYSDVSVKIYNIMGQLISSEKYNSAKMIQQEINVSTGMYFVKVSTAKEGSNTLRIIKQ
ncbi:subtilase family protease [Aequorivita sublithincola DSM 14238]|uniref:Subtilase family protease n=1 Tax=Aequorivita sublithincola (strain DSM 14238 / LMG 21431 / ACAM 643 / 9-3) TaxID=746697 RepID=I3YVY2_AEQSU|nr:S8 family peptidase [Aequorivita sublithincola]AFL81150.1 subtilase family protease [Aequorivita sublithincola DSM 14238]